MPYSESDQEHDQIASWLQFPSDSNENEEVLVRSDLNKQQTMMGSNNMACATVLHSTEGMIPSTSLAKRNDAVNVSEKKVGTSHATRVKKKGKEIKGRCQVGELGSRGKRKDILEPPCILPKRLRAPEVHRLNERRRRDKFNEKIKTLQELIPRCNKLDKASTLDKAIGYMKDLQMQVLMMSPGYDMGTQMFYGMARPYMQSMRMCTDMSIPTLQAIHANMNTRMCLGPGMIPIGPALQYPHKPYQAPPMHMLPQHDIGSSMFLFPQAGDPRMFPSFMQGNFQM